MKNTIAVKPVIAIAGNPNSGKTTLFNRLTGLRQKVANYPGITVEKKTGKFISEEFEIQLIDLPGTYSLNPHSEEEKIAAGTLTGTYPGEKPTSGVLCVVDSSCLGRGLGLALQIVKTRIPAAVLLNMSDELKIRGLEIDSGELAKLLGVPVFSISALTGEGLDKVRELIVEWAKAGTPPEIKTGTDDNDLAETEERRQIVKEICRKIIKRSSRPLSTSDKIDRFVMHPVWGPLIFGAVVIVVFQAIFALPQPLMNLIDSSFTSLSFWIKKLVPIKIVGNFLAEAVVTGTGSVVVFLPQILTLFFFIALLEYSGYMARASMVMDKFMSKMGLQGKSFLPLISSCACAVPGIMASRIIENRRDRLATIFISPLMPCGARLPVYTLLIGAFVPNVPVIKGILGLRSLTLLGLFLAGFLAALITAWALKSSVLKSDLTPFILEIPPYRKPPLGAILMVMWERTKIFLKRAGGIILLVSVILWFFLNFPKGSGAEPVKESIAGRIGTILEPVIKPLGFDWKIGVGLLSAQAAREMIISSLSTIYRIEQKKGPPEKLQSVLRENLAPLQAVSLMVFFVFAMQCFSTLAIARREVGHWKVSAAMFLYMNLLAYLSSLLVFQGGRLLGF